MFLARWHRFWHCLKAVLRLRSSCRGLSMWFRWRIVFVGCTCGRVFDFRPAAFAEVLARFEAMPLTLTDQSGDRCQRTGCGYTHTATMEYGDGLFLVCPLHAAKRTLWVLVNSTFDSAKAMDDGVDTVGREV